MSAIIGVLTSLIGAVTGAFSRYQDRKQAEQSVTLAQEEARRQLAMKTIEAELELGQTQVRATGRYFKYFTFCLWFGPFVISTFLPEYGQQIFKNWETMPDWYSQSVLVIIFAIWGIQAGKESIGTIFANLGQHMLKRQKASINKQLFYATLRSTKGPIGQAEVDLYEKALAASNSETEQ